MNEYQIAIVAPVHIQVSKQWVQALKSITAGKSNVKVIIIDDSDGKVELPGEWDVYDYARQEEVLGELYPRFKVFQKSSACKNLGHYIAWKEDFDIIIGLDSDCIVPPNFIGQHVEALLKSSTGWTNPIKNTGWFPRGYPFKQRSVRTILNLGLWEHELDLYGKDRVDRAPELPPASPMSPDSKVADGFLPLSGMNWACWAEAIPGLLFLPNFEYQHGDKLIKFRRHDDIWGGYIFQKLMAIREERIRFGNPIVYHDTVIDAQRDADEEEGMLAFENMFYASVDGLISQGDIEWGMYDDMFCLFADEVEKNWKESEWAPLVDPIKLWSELFA